MVGSVIFVTPQWFGDVEYYSARISMEVDDTGGEGQFTQWVHCEFIVGFETIHPAHTQ